MNDHVKAIPKKNALRRVLNVTSEFGSLMSVGREFQSLGAKEENAHHPSSRVLGTTKRPL